jgi:dienelactone hydrolase
MRATGHAAVAVLAWIGLTLSAQADNENFIRGNWQDPGIEFRITMQPAHEGGLTGELYLPKDSGKRPALLALGACTKEFLRGMAQGMADHGYPTLALFYCGADTAQPDLRETPVEIFKAAIDWLAAQPSVDPDHIGIIGASAGATAALLAAANDPRIKAVVAVVPGNVVWQAPVDGVPPRSMYTLHGAPLPFLSGDGSLPVGARIEQMRESAVHAVPGAIIPVEQIKGAILLLSGEEDWSWPSAFMADRIVARLKEKNFPRPYENYSYPDAGHGFFAAHDSSDPWFSALYARLMNPTAFPETGGTLEGNTAAQRDSWPKTLAFLRRYLNG